MQCPECATTAPAPARFCHRCGAALPGDGPTSPAQTEGGAAAPAPRRERGPERDTSVLTASRRSGATVRDCPSCGASNSPMRELCGRCGADLESGVRPPRPTTPAPPADRQEPPHARSRRPTWRRVLVLVVSAAAVVGLIVLALALAGLGPFADSAEIPEASFASDVYGERPAPLPLSDIATTTTLPPSGGERYGAPQMADGDPTTAWNSDGEVHEDGVGERIDLFLEQPGWIDRIVIANGHQRDAESYADNARIRRAELVLDGRQRLSVRLEDLGRQRQVIELPQPRLTTTVHLEVTETFAGDTYPDLAVSDIALEGWTAQGEDVETARIRAERARAVPRGR